MVKKILIIGISILFLGICINPSNGNINNAFFNFKSNNPPYEPSNPHPENGATDVSVNVILNWTCDDPDGDNLTYDIYFGNYTPPPKVLTDGSAPKYDPPGVLEFCTTYYWQIVVWDEHGESTPGPIWNFTTRCNDPPNTPIPIYPPNGSADIPIDLYLEWNCTDPDRDDITYDIYFGNTSPPQIIEYNWPKKIYEDFPFGTTIEFNTTYYWKIVAWDEYGASSEGDIWYFITEQGCNLPPDVPYIDGPTKCKPFLEYNYTFVSNDPDKDNVIYYIDWGDGTFVDWFGPFDSGLNVTKTHIWPSGNQIYKLRAKASDIYGAESDWGYLDIEVPRNRATSYLWYDWFLECFPLMERLLSFLK